LIIYAGGFPTIEALSGLKQLGEVKAVQGNMDSDEIINILPTRDVIE